MFKRIGSLLALIVLLGCVSSAGYYGVVVKGFSAEKYEVQSKEFFDMNLWVENDGDYNSDHLFFTIYNTGNLINQSSITVQSMTLTPGDDFLASWTFETPELSAESVFTPYAKICYNYTSEAYMDIQLVGLEWKGTTPNLLSGSSKAPITLSMQATNPYKGEVSGKSIKIILENTGPEKLKQINYLSVKIPGIGGKLEVTEESGFFTCTHNTAGDYYACTARDVLLNGGLEKSLRLIFNTHLTGQDHYSARIHAYAYYTYCSKTDEVRITAKPAVPGEALEGVCSQDSLEHCGSMNTCLLAGGYWCDEAGSMSCTDSYVSGEAPEEVSNPCFGVPCGNGICESDVENCGNCPRDCGCNKDECCNPESSSASAVRGCVFSSVAISSESMCCSGDEVVGNCCDVSDCPSGWNCYSNYCYQRTQCVSDLQCGSGQKCCDNECVDKCFSNLDCSSWNGCYFDEVLSYDVYQVFECENKGSCDASCVVARTLELDCACPEGRIRCESGCVTPACLTNDGCTFRKGYIASCINPGTCVANCIYVPEDMELPPEDSEPLINGSPSPDPELPVDEVTPEPPSEISVD